MNDFYVSIPALSIMKSNPGEMDEEGNYIFEVEASNENVDLQNQKILAKALEDSEEYFMSNGVISDDHQHRTKNNLGEVVTNYDKVIGEPLKVYRKNKRTFVKGKLYGGVEAAKPFINLLKSHSTRVKASVGGLMPHTIQNPDGTETITGFMWNDLALTCSPVNSTVAPAVFAKSLSVDEFAKAMAAGSVVNPVEKTGGSAIIKENIEGNKVEIKNLEADEEEDNVEKSVLDATSLQEMYGKRDEIEDVKNEVINRISTDELKDYYDVLEFIVNNYGYTVTEAEAMAKEIEQKGKEESTMMKFAERMNSIFKSFGKKCEEVEKCDKVSKSEDSEMEEDDDKQPGLFDDEVEKSFEEEDEIDIEEDEDEEEDKPVKKSNDEDELVSLDQVLKAVDTRLDQLEDRTETESLNEKIDELQKSVLQMGEIIANFASQPELRKSIMVDTNNSSRNEGYIKPTQSDFETFKQVLCNAKRAGAIDLRKSVHLESVFQKELHGTPMTKEDRAEAIQLYNNYRG